MSDEHVLYGNVLNSVSGNVSIAFRVRISLSSGPVLRHLNASSITTTEINLWYCITSPLLRIQGLLNYVLEATCFQTGYYLWLLPDLSSRRSQTVIMGTVSEINYFTTGSAESCFIAEAYLTLVVRLYFGQLILKAQIMTAADDNFCDTFLNFR